MRHLLTILAALLFCAPAFGQTVKALSYNTNGVVIYSSTNTLTFTNAFKLGDDLLLSNNIFHWGTNARWSPEDNVFSTEIQFDSTNIAAATRTNLALGATWLTNTNVTNFRTAIGLGATNDVNFSRIVFNNEWHLASSPDGGGIELRWPLGNSSTAISFGDNAVGKGIALGGLTTNEINHFSYGFASFNTTGAAKSRTNFGLGATWLTNTNVTNFRSAIGAGTVNEGGEPTFQSITLSDSPDTLYLNANAATTRSNLGLGGNNIVTFAGLTNNGDITINQTTATNGLLFIRRTNNEPFLGLANLIASNNTTISNETLFRVGVAEATNKAAQFGFRSTNTNGNGVAVFSVFGFNALMMVGADASTNAVIYSGGGTNNEVMTLIRDGATEFARPIRFSTNASTRPATNAPANTTAVAAWVEMRIGTNSYRVPLYQ